MTNMRKVFICFFSMLLWFGLSGCAEAEPEQPENVEIHFFYNQPCNLGYVIFQDIWTFPKTFSDYEEYKEKTPFLIPDWKSIKACMASFAEGRGRK